MRSGIISFRFLSQEVDEGTRMDQYVDQVDNPFHLKEGGYLYVIDRLHRLNALRDLSAVLGMELTSTCLSALLIMRRYVHYLK